jgi:prepilin peptidase CpaA
LDADKTKPMQTIAWWPVVTVLTIATITDLRSHRIPNWLVFPFLLAGMVVSTLVNGWRGLGDSFLGILLAAVLMGMLYVLGGMGMGDVKLCAAVGAWVGPHQLAFSLAFMGLAGGVMALGWALRHGSLGKSLAGAGDLIFGAGKRGLRRHPTLVLTNPAAQRMPYAPAIAVGAIFSFFARG